MAQGLRMVGSRLRGLAMNPPPFSSSTHALARRGISIAPGERERAVFLMRRAICEHAKKACMHRPVAAAACKKACSCQRSCPLHHASPPGLSSFASSSLFSRTDHLVSRFSTRQNSSEGPLPTDFSSLLDEKEFHKLADELLDYLQEKIDELGEEHEIDGFDIDHAEGVLTIKLGASGTYVINKQTPNRQIWLSSPVSGPARFDWDVKDCCWVYRRTKSEILQLLEKEIHELLGSSINLSKRAVLF